MFCLQKFYLGVLRNCFLFVFFSRTQVSVVSWCFFCQSYNIRFNLEQTIKDLSAAFDGSVLQFSWNHSGQWFGRIIRWGLWRGSPFLDDNKFTTKLNLRMDSQGVCDWVLVYDFDVQMRWTVWEVGSLNCENQLIFGVNLLVISKIFSL